MDKNTIRILHFTSYNEDCGIAKYQEQFINGMVGHKEVVNEVFPYSPYQIRRMTQSQKNHVAREIYKQLKDFDILHIQHEFGFYDGDELVQIVDAAHRQGKKILVTMHTSPTYAYPKVVRAGFGPRSLVDYARQRRGYAEFMRTRFEPVKKADMVVVHNEATKADLISHGVDAAKVVIIRHPVRTVDTSKHSSEIADNLHRVEGDVIYASVGFPSERKGALDSVKALAYLPKNYKLAIIGGVHPSGENEPLIDMMADLALKLDVSDRVYITGYVKDDEVLNSLIRETDVCVYPYVKEYYDHVSSGALNHAIGNHMPVIAYPTQSFIEMNTEIPVVQFTKSFNYYELARSLQNVDFTQAAKLSVQYAKMFNWPQEAQDFIKNYKLLSGR